MRWFPLVLTTSCAFAPTTTGPKTTADTGGSSTITAGCAGFVAPTFVPGTCPGGGLASDLVVDVRPRDATGATCSFCAAGPISFDLIATNPCGVDVDVPTGGCLVDSRSIGSADGSRSTAMTCSTPTSTVPIAVPASGEQSLGVERFYDPFAAGRYDVAFGFQVIPTASTSICVE